MKKVYTKAQLVKYLLEDPNIPISNEDELINLLVETQISYNSDEINQNDLTVGQRMADKIANFAGSWKFIIAFLLIITLWFFVNLYMLSRPFDPYPFILLNLLLSCIAALQAPLIMMSQNRQDEKDRLRSIQDYKINLKSEFLLEILHKNLTHSINKITKLEQKIQSLEEQLLNNNKK